MGPTIVTNQHDVDHTRCPTPCNAEHSHDPHNGGSRQQTLGPHTRGPESTLLRPGPESASHNSLSEGTPLAHVPSHSVTTRGDTNPSSYTLGYTGGLDDTRASVVLYWYLTRFAKDHDPPRTTGKS